jgi:hypothetical protein
MTDLAAQRRFFSEEIQACANLRSTTLVDALATIPRERFLPPGPWNTMPAMGPIGKGPLLLATRGTDAERWQARLVTFVAIYSALGLRDSALNGQLGVALRKSPFPAIRSLRRDPHAVSEACWLHGAMVCISLE